MPNPNHIPHEVQHAMMTEMVEGGCPAGILPHLTNLVESFFRGYALKYQERGHSQIQGMSAAAQSLTKAAAVHIAESTMARMADTSQPTPTGPLEVHDDDSRKALVMASTTSVMWTGLALLTGAWYAADEGDFTLLGQGELEDGSLSQMSLSEFYHYIASVIERDNGDEAAERDREEFRQVSAMAHAMQSEGEGPDDPVVNFREVSDAMMAEEMPGFMEAMDKLLEDNDDLGN